MELISYKEFEKLRISNFTAPQGITPIQGIEFMGDYWNGEAIGFTEFLSLDINPNKTQSISLDFQDFELQELDSIFKILQLPLYNKMSFNEIEGLFGEPTSIDSFVSDRKSYNYVLGHKEPYYVSFTVVKEIGLIYLVMMNHVKSIDILKKLK